VLLRWFIAKRGTVRGVHWLLGWEGASKRILLPFHMGCPGPFSQLNQTGRLVRR